MVKFTSIFVVGSLASYISAHPIAHRREAAMSNDLAISSAVAKSNAEWSALQVREKNPFPSIVRMMTAMKKYIAEKKAAMATMDEARRKRAQADIIEAEIIFLLGIQQDLANWGLTASMTKKVQAYLISSGIMENIMDMVTEIMAYANELRAEADAIDADTAAQVTSLDTAVVNLSKTLKAQNEPEFAGPIARLNEIHANIAAQFPDLVAQ